MDSVKYIPFLLITLITFLIGGCDGAEEQSNQAILSNSVDDFVKLSGIDNLDIENIEWQYIPMQKRESNRINTPGPNDYNMLASVKVSANSINKLSLGIENNGHKTIKLKTEQFNFNWLDKTMKEKVINYSGYVYDIKVLNDKVAGGFIIIDSTLLINYFTL